MDHDIVTVCDVLVDHRIAPNPQDVARPAGRNEIVQVGDGADDRSAAEQAGCHFVAVAACGGEAYGTAGIPAVRDLRELIDLLPKLCGAQT